MDVSKQENTKDEFEKHSKEESELESYIKTPEELKAKNQESFYDKIDEWRKYFNPIDTQGPQVF